MRRWKLCVSSIAILMAWYSAYASAQAPPPPPPTPTIWNFLGIPQALNKIHANTFNRRGNLPGLEKKPPLLKIADPANLKSDVPAIKAAAEIKQAEDLKPQKIKAIKYLATIGCGCYDKDEKVTKALLAAMEDCTEDVRLEAVRAISVAASSERCATCKQRSCCNEKVTAQLYKIAYELDDLGCHVEPSERVREAAIEALGVCCPGRLPVTTPVEPTPVEGVDQPPPVEGVPAPLDAAPPPPVVPDASAQVTPTVDPNNFLREASLLDQAAAMWSNPPQPPALAPEVAPAAKESTSPSRNETAAAPTPAEPSRPAEAFTPASGPAADISTPASDAPRSSRRTARMKTTSFSSAPTAGRDSPAAQGTVAMIDGRRNLAHVHFTAGMEPLPVGARLRVLVPAADGTRHAGDVEVVQSFPGSATVKGLEHLNLARIGRDARIVR
ncbi:MAG: hypothetical protein AB7O38_02990 [Pirellulaceae bacterium]